MVMLLDNSRLNRARVASRQNEAAVAEVQSIVVNAANLEIDCFWIVERATGRDLVLHRSDIDRTAMHPSGAGPKLGLIVSSRDQFIDPAEIDNYVRIKQTLEANYNPLGARVVDTDGNKVGKVTGFNFDDQSLTIVQLVVGALGVKRNLSQTSLLIHRSQIREVHDDHIVVAGDKGRAKLSLKRLINLGQKEADAPGAPAPLNKEL